VYSVIDPSLGDTPVVELKLGNPEYPREGSMLQDTDIVSLSAI
jgi:hypothetical protein